MFARTSFSVDYRAVDSTNVIGIHKYLIEAN